MFQRTCSDNGKLHYYYSFVPYSLSLRHQCLQAYISATGSCMEENVMYNSITNDFYKNRCCNQYK